MISINFAQRNYRLIARTRAGLVAGCALLVIVLAGLLWTAASLRADAAAMGERLREAAAEDDRLRPVLGEREQLIKDLTSMSGLMESRKHSWTRFLSSIESVVPRGVALKSVVFNEKERVVMLDGAAQSPESLRALVLGLEMSPSFRDPFLKHQSLEKGSISFNVLAVYHEDSGVVASGVRR